MQRAILEMRRGPENGAKAVLAPGERIRVGRKPRAQWIVRDDQMSGVHFEVEWDGARCEVRDLKSATGTLVSGEKIARPVEIGNGGWIRAGSTDFMVYFEAATPPPIDDDAYLDDAEEGEVEPLAWLWLEQNRDARRLAREALAARRESALQKLQSVDGPLFAVIDAARADRILILVREAVERYQSLYEGVEGEALSHVAPHLVELPKGSGLLQRLVREGWEGRWASFIEAPLSFKELRRHMRRFLMVADAETRKKMYFRFYDPGVLRSFIPTCTPKQRAEFFGEIKAFYVEDPDGNVARFGAEEP
ncbi:MAG: DUF4123 domain-containing protein [Polyangiaceae bacterium]|nr:DUF4123 domain-containing protein [Polyangiaceae bacterium]